MCHTRYSDDVSGRRLGRIAVLATLVMAALAASHQLIYLLAHGTGAEYARAMREGGHDRYWTSFVLTVAMVTVVLGVVAVRQLRRLQRQTSLVRAGQLNVDDRGVGLFARLVAGLWMPVSAGTFVAFVTQENLEMMGAGRLLPGLHVVSGEHAIAVPAIALMSFLVALVGALVRWGRHVLLARLHLSSGLIRRRAPRALRPSSVNLPTSTSTVRSHGLRAPPMPVPLIA